MCSNNVVIYLCDLLFTFTPYFVVQVLFGAIAVIASPVSFCLSPRAELQTQPRAGGNNSKNDSNNNNNNTCIRVEEIGDSRCVLRECLNSGSSNV